MLSAPTTIPAITLADFTTGFGETTDSRAANSSCRPAGAFGAGRAAGLSETQLRELLRASPMVAPALRYRFEGVVTGGAGDAVDHRPWREGREPGGRHGECARVSLPPTATGRELYGPAAPRSETADIAAVGGLYRTLEAMGPPRRCCVSLA